jgi:hypothetical protein
MEERAMKRTWLVTIGLAAAIVLPAWAADALKVKISAAKKTVRALTTGQQNIGASRTSLETKDIVYEFQFTSMVPSPPPGLYAEWIVMVEEMNGRLSPGASGRSDLALQFARPYSITTDPIQLQEREWRHRWNSGEIEQKIFGYGIRIKNADDQILTEDYSSDKARKAIDWELVDRERDKEHREERIREWWKRQGQRPPQANPRGPAVTPRPPETPPRTPEPAPQIPF